MVSEDAYAALVAENAALKAQLEQVRARLAEALRELEALKAQKTPPPSWVKANVPPRPAAERKKRAPEHNRGRRREAPTRVIEHRPERCVACGGRLSGLTLARRRQVVELPPPPPVEVVEHRVYRGWCSYCHRWRAAPLELGGQALGRGRLGVGIAGLVAHLHVTLRLPLRAIQRYLADLHGLRVSVGELVDLLRRVAAAGRGAYAGLRAQVRASAVALGDETTWREDGRNGYVWHVGTPAGVRYYAYHHSRAGAVINDLLGEEFRGVLVTDFYAGYNDTPGGQHQRCWVHLLRALHDLKREHPGATEVASWARAVKALYTRARAVAARPPPAREPAHARLVAAAVALGARFAQAPGHPCRALAQRLLRHQGELFTFVLRDDVPADNNGAERGVRPVVVARKISGGSRSPQGSATRMVLTSLAETWRAQGRNPLDEFRRLLHDPLPQL